MPDDSVSKYFVSERLFNSGIKIEKASKAYENVLKNAGANLYRDQVDQKIIADVKEGTADGEFNGIINSQEEVGGWPEIISKEGPVDTDGDGIPDEWEIKYGLNPNNKEDGSQYKLEKYYTNLEMYLNSLLKQVL